MAEDIKKEEEIDLGKNLKKLAEISTWLESQEQSDEPDFEQGLVKVKEAAALIKASRERLTKIGNEFEEIKKEIEPEDVKEE